MLSLQNNLFKNLRAFAASFSKTEKAIFVLISLYAGFAMGGHQLFFTEYPVQQVFIKICILLLHAVWLGIVGFAFLYFTHASRMWLAVKKSQVAAPRSTLKLYTIFLSIMIGWWLLWLIAFYPATMSTDSFDHWKQVTGAKQLNDLHPILYTLIIKALTGIWNSPAIIALFQIVALGSVMASFLVFLYKAGIPYRWLLILAILTAIIPVNGIMAITLWKDILFCVCLVWLTLTITEIITGIYIFNERATLVCLCVSLVGVALLRHNGVLASWCVTLALFILAIKTKRRGLMVSLALFLLVFFTYKKVLMPYVFKVPPVADGFQKTPLVHGMASVMVYNGTLAPETRAEMIKLLPEEKWKELYNPYSSDGYIYETGTPFIENLSEVPTSKVMSLYTKTFFANPWLITKDRLSGCELLWNVNQGEGSGNYAWLPVIEENDLGFKQSDDNGLRKVFIGMLKFAGRALDPLSRRAGIYNILFLLLFLYMFKQRKISLLIFIPLFAANLSLVLSMTFQTFRYVYYIPLLFGVVWLLAVSGIVYGKKVPSVKV
jgi:hypothetical protein